MLTYRTNILFDEETIRLLKKQARTRKMSVGKFIRTVVKEKLSQDDIYAKRKKALETILKIRPPVSKTPIDYKELINYGRKY